MSSRKSFVKAEPGASPTYWVIAIALVLVMVSGTFLGIAAGLFEKAQKTDNSLQKVQPISEPTTAPPAGEAETDETPGAKFVPARD